ncbi:MAG: response regulator transcription factor [Gemmatimonadota bacterium]
MSVERSPGAVKPRLILVDDHRMFVDSLRDALAATYDIVGVAYSGGELLALLRTRSADCLLLDLQLPDRHGLELIPDVLALRPALMILIVTMFLDRCLAEAALTAGAHGFIPKDAGRDELQRAITEVLAGARYVSPRVPKTSHRTSLEALHPALQRLTPRQQAVFRLLGDGRTEAEIAHILCVSPPTITFHKQNIQRVLGFPTSALLAQYALLVRICLEERDNSAGAPRSGAKRRERPRGQPSP